MSNAQFEALYDELMAKGDKKKLMDLSSGISLFRQRVASYNLH
jgi:hypothetical protein